MKLLDRRLWWRCGMALLANGLAFFPSSLRGDGIVPASESLMNATFNNVADGLLENFSLISNGIGSPAWDTATGQASMSANQASNGAVGCVSDSSFDGTLYAVVTATMIIDSIVDPDGEPTNNGHWAGLTGNDFELWNNSERAGGVNGWSLGVRFLNGSVNLTYDSAAGNEVVIAPLGSYSVASLQDGYTVQYRFDEAGWEVCLVGLVGSVDAQGAWPAAFDYSVLQSDDSIYASMTYQQLNEAGTVVDVLSFSIEGDLESTTSLDSDDDGMPNNFEVANGLNPNDPSDAGGDLDSDDLTNLAEFENGTDPQDDDSDNDGLSDGEEVHGTLNAWLDGVQSGPPGDPTDPLVADTDGDGMTDHEEILAGTDPNVVPPNTGPLFPFIDTDGDSYHDEAEIAFGSNPQDADDCPDHRPTVTKPNIVIIYADDLGFGDISAYGDIYGTTSPALTPNIDSISTDGVTFLQGHSGNAVCTPSRYALLTGKYNWREFNGITNNWGGPIGGGDLPRASDVTIAEFLKTQNYDTAAFGKWHLGGDFFRTNGTVIRDNPSNAADVDWERPVELHAVAHGFDHFRGNACAINFVPYVYMIDDRMQFWDPSLNGGGGAYRPALNSDPFRYWTTAEVNAPVRGRTGSRAGLGDPSYSQVNVGPQLFSDVEDYIADRASSGDPDPFFAYVSMNSPHYPWALTDEFVGEGVANGFLYADWMREVDDRVGRVLTALENHGFGSNTLVIFTADNGPEWGAMIDSIANNADSNGPLRGNKRDAWDGGTRVPFMVRWPGQAAAGLKVNHPIWQGDIFATIAAFLGSELPDSTAPDGESFLNLLRGQQKPEPQRPAIVMSSVHGHLGLKTNDGWKFLDSTGGGGDHRSWDSSNIPITSPAGTNQGIPKQLFHQAIDLGEDSNLLASVTNDSSIRSEMVSLVGDDLLGLLDQLRGTESTSLFPRIPDNDGDLMPNSYESANGLDPNWPKDAAGDEDGDGAANLAEFVAGTDPNDGDDVLGISRFEMQNNGVNVSWLSVDDRNYELVWSRDLIEWTPISSHAGTGGELSVFVDLGAIENEPGFTGDLDLFFVRLEVTISE